MKNKNITFNLGKRELQKIKAVCDAFLEIAKITQDKRVLTEDEVRINYAEICVLMDKYEREWGGTGG